ncbi:hypothetical protein KVV02_008301 [Mortierella alpina]|uniref:Solute carrier family 40 member n=1 Tax=Mortierella alpina TaxID=64518 RepID=A0A9P8A3A6_MORAP|nr:hypothetical protein KVV02_008301 [Mortierella alpina]
MSPHSPSSQLLSPSSTTSTENSHCSKPPHQPAQPLLHPTTTPKIYSATPPSDDHSQGHDDGGEHCMGGEDRGDHEMSSKVPSKTLYAVHALCTFDERIYEFASYFFIMEIFKTTLLPMSIFGFSTTVAGIMFSTTVGSLVDSTPRLAAVQSFLFTQKVSTIFGALGFWILLTWFDPASGATHIGGLSLYQGYGVFIFLILINGVLKLSALGWSISIERDWVVALCRSDSEQLTQINVAMKRIDLVCKLVSPLVFAALLARVDAAYCSLAMAIWCLCTFCMELYLVRRIWAESSILWEPRSRHSHHCGPDGAKSDMRRRRSGRDLLDTRSPSVVERVISSFQEYTHHIVFLASLSYAIIYINMMSVSGTMIGYLQWRGFTAGSIALLKGVCTASELVGTIAMPVVVRYVGLVRGGAWSVWLEVATLTPVLFSIYSDDLPIQVFIFAGMALSRVGVWSFDLVITQIMQEYIQSDLDNAGIINGWHYSMINLFELAQFVLTMIWSDPDLYFIPCTLSLACVVIGALVYSGYLVQMRGHLFHYQRIASAASSYVAVAPDTIDDDGSPGPSINVRRASEDGGAGVLHRRPVS